MFLVWMLVGGALVAMLAHFKPELFARVVKESELAITKVTTKE